MLHLANTALHSVRIRLHVSAKNDWPSSGPVARIQKGINFTTLSTVVKLTTLVFFVVGPNDG